MKKRVKKIIILGGKARQGKDTICEYIQDYYKDLKCLYLPNNYYMRDYAKRISGWNGEDATKPRELINDLADLGRKKDEQFYLKRTLEDIDIFSYYFDIILISDARFAFEMTIPKEKFDNVYTIMVTRPNYDSDISEKAKQHNSEFGFVGFKDYDYDIINDGDLNDLRDKTYKVLDKIEEESK